MSILSKPILPLSDHPPGVELFAEDVPPKLIARRDFESPETAGGVNFCPPRCAEKGCIFPASAESSPWCAHHERERREPELFISRQPSRLAIERATFDQSGSEEALFRARDRRTRAAMWEAFTNEGLGDGET